MIDFPASPTIGQVFISGAQSWTWDGAKWVASGVYVGPPQFSNTNRIINGDMRIDQRNNGASGTANGVYTVDRWLYGAAQANKGAWGRSPAGGVLLAQGFGYLLAFTSSSAYAALAADYFDFLHRIEADMVSDFAWGTPNAQPVTLSFWAYSTLTGTFGGAITNLPVTRSYPFSFNIPTASTWAKYVITIPGDTAGTWVMSGNAGGVAVVFDLGSGVNFRTAANAWASGNYTGVTGAVSVVGTNGAQFYLTGVKLEIGSIATPFNRKSPQESLADCQRYYQTGTTFVGGYGVTGATLYDTCFLPVTMRAGPISIAFTNPTYANASTLSNVQSNPAYFTASITMTATATGWGQSPTTFSAEL